MRIKLNGPPGTGKTTILIKAVKKAVDTGIYAPDRIGFLSFSKAATEEARGRIDKKLTDGFNKYPWFRTIHSACFKLLGIPHEHTFNKKWANVFREETRMELTEEEIEKDEVFEISTGKTRWDVAGSIYTYSILTGEDWEHVFNRKRWEWYNAPDYEEMESFIEKYERFKNPIIPTPEHPRLYDYNDMLLEVDRKELCPPLDLLIVDEAQDLSPLMFRIIERWSEQIETTVIAGDPYQAIYEFQGASPYLMMGWRADIERTLDQSFRCPSQVHSSARIITERMTRRYPNDNFNPREKGGFVKSVYDFPSYDGLGKNTSFYLARTNKEVKKIEIELQGEGIPYNFTRKKSKAPILSDYAKGISILEKLRQGQKISYLEFDEILDFVPQKGNMTYGEKARIRQLKPTLSDWARVDKNIHIDKLSAWGWTEQGITNLRTAKIYNKLSGIREEQKNYILRVIERDGFHAIGKIPPLSIGTIHSVKGKEADIICIKSNFVKVVAKSFNKTPDPEHRLAYVGVTRAKVGAYIVDPVYKTEGAYYPYPTGCLPDYTGGGEPLDRDRLINEILGLPTGTGQAEDDWDFDEGDMPF